MMANGGCPLSKLLAGAERCMAARVLARREQRSHRCGYEVLDMRRLRPSSEAEMVALFLRTELPAARFRDTLQALLDQAGLPERLVTAPDLDDPGENQAPGSRR
jgi:hypothetical protein